MFLILKKECQVIVSKMILKRREIEEHFHYIFLCLDKTQCSVCQDDFYLILEIQNEHRCNQNTIRFKLCFYITFITLCRKNHQNKIKIVVRTFFE
jgi:hypothetical protein